MDRHSNDLTTDEAIDRALEQAREFESEPRIVQAIYHAEPDLDLLILKLTDGRRLVYPREELPELREATPEQAASFVVGQHGRDVWWPLLDDGIYLPNLLGQPLEAKRPENIAA